MASTTQGCVQLYESRPAVKHLEQNHLLKTACSMMEKKSNGSSSGSQGPANGRKGAGEAVVEKSCSLWFLEHRSVTSLSI